LAGGELVSLTERLRDQAEPGGDFACDHGPTPAALRRTWLAAPVALRAANSQRHAGLERSRAALLSLITHTIRISHQNGPSGRLRCALWERQCVLTFHSSAASCSRGGGRPSIPIIQNEPIVDPNCVLGQPLRPARKRPSNRSRGAYEARGATRNFRTEVGSSTRRHPVARRR
jgi:hypothetical protein